MVQHICNRCGYTTNRKQNLKSHLLRKNLCQPEINQIDRYDLLVLNGFDEESKMYEKVTKNTQNNTFSPQNNTFSPQNNTKKYICKFCNKGYTRIDSLNRHKNYYCKEKKNISSQVQILMQNIVIMQQEMELIKKQNKEKDKLIDKLLKNNKPNLNKGVINNAKQQINNNNLTINNFGSENIDYITAKVFYKLLNTPYNAIPKLIELKHFNPKHPENHNVKITNIHDKYAKIYKDKKWIIQHKTDVLETMIDNGFADLEEFKDLNEEEFTDKFMDKYKLVEQVIDNGNVKEKIILISKNGTDRVFKNDIIV
tara:strand:+ start:601 stop:1533 length:933 start_codon:yes stop_codon:yes gene_type:complete